MKLAIFDFDGTLLKKDTLPCLGRAWKRQKRSMLRYTAVYISIMPYVVLNRVGLLPRERLKVNAMERFHRLFDGLKEDEIIDFFEKASLDLPRFFNKQVVAEILKAREEGFHTVLLSGTYALLLKEIGKRLGIDTVLAVELPFKGDLIDYETEIPFIDGEMKLRLLEQAFCGAKIEWNESRSYADSMSDLSVMTIVGEPVAVRPEPGLLSYALENSWRVIAG